MRKLVQNNEMNYTNDFTDDVSGVTNFSSRPAGLPAEAGSKLISKAALQLRPRYHFSGVTGIHYERQPYRNHRVANEPARHVTRFIGLGKVGLCDTCSTETG